MSKRLDLASRIGGALDDALLGALSVRFGRRRPGAKAPRAPEVQDRRALLAEAIAFYRPLAESDAFFPVPPEPKMVTERRGRGVVDLKWESAFVAHWPLVRADYAAFEPNRFAYARVFQHPRPAPAIVCLHGYRGGPFFVEERAFPVKWLHQIGLNVALFQLPFHGRRGGPDAPVWPSVNVARTNEGFAQTIADLRQLMVWLRKQSGHPDVAVIGMSLGGYTAALLATVEPLAFAAPMIPVASFPDLLWGHGRDRPERERAEREGITVEMLREAMAVHTPLERAPRVPRERMLVMTALGDRIAPPEHGARLARHFGCEEHQFAGGHILQLGRGDAFRALARRLAALGLIRR